MKTINITIVRLLLLFYLTSSYLSAIHIHNKVIKKHGDCKVCIVVKNLNSGDTTNIDIDSFSCSNCYELINLEQQRFIVVQLKGFNSNAPPFFS